MYKILPNLFLVLSSHSFKECVMTSCFASFGLLRPTVTRTAGVASGISVLTPISSAASHFTVNRSTTSTTTRCRTTASTTQFPMRSSNRQINQLRLFVLQLLFFYNNTSSFFVFFCYILLLTLRVVNGFKVIIKVPKNTKRNPHPPKAEKASLSTTGSLWIISCLLPEPRTIAVTPHSSRA